MCSACSTNRALSLPSQMARSVLLLRQMSVMSSSLQAMRRQTFSSQGQSLSYCPAKRCWPTRMRSRQSGRRLTDWRAKALGTWSPCASVMRSRRRPRKRGTRYILATSCPFAALSSLSLLATYRYSKDALCIAVTVLRTNGERPPSTRNSRRHPHQSKQPTRTSHTAFSRETRPPPQTPLRHTSSQLLRAGIPRGLRSHQSSGRLHGRANIGGPWCA